MRLTCPNCEAQYEVPDDAVPAAGRDVQCSNCSHTWFAQPKLLGGAIRSDVPEPEPTSFQPPRRPDRAPPEEDFKAVLREEATRELAARQADSNPDLEIQPDLGLDTIPAADEPNLNDVRAASAAPAAPYDDAADDIAEPVLSARRNQLPDIEDINSSLSAASKSHVRKADKNTQASPADRRVRRRRGFRFGFVLALFILAIFVAVYIFAPDLALQFPNLADELNNYVLWVNDIRQTMFKWADDVVGSIAEAGTTPADQN